MCLSDRVIEVNCDTLLLLIDIASAGDKGRQEVRLVNLLNNKKGNRPHHRPHLEALELAGLITTRPVQASNATHTTITDTGLAYVRTATAHLFAHFNHLASPQKATLP